MKITGKVKVSPEMYKNYRYAIMDEIAREIVDKIAKRFLFEHKAERTKLGQIEVSASLTILTKEGIEELNKLACNYPELYPIIKNILINK